MLPFENLTHDPSQEYFVEGMREALITNLVQQGAAQVTSRNTVRNAANLILGTTDQNVWANSYDRDLKDVLKLLNEVSGAIAGEVRSRLGTGAASPTPTAGAGDAADETASPQVRPEVYEAYRRGRYLVNQFPMSQQIPAAREHFLLATSLDPGFAPAWSGLPVGKVAALFRQTWHLSVTARGIIRAIQRAGQRARPTYQALVTAIHDSPMVVPDETGWRENGQSC